MEKSHWPVPAVPPLTAASVLILALVLHRLLTRWLSAPTHDPRFSPSTRPALLATDPAWAGFLLAGTRYIAIGPRLLRVFVAHKTPNQCKDDDNHMPNSEQNTAATYSIPARRKERTIVFLHGIGGHVANFAPLMSLFSSFATIVGIDYVGHGGSPDTGIPADYTPASIADDVCRVLASLCLLDSNAAIVCHSYGCLVGAIVSRSLRPAAAIFLAPVACLTPSAARARHLARILPNYIVDFLRWIDGIGGPMSPSVCRFLGPAAAASLRLAQMHTNRHLTANQLKAMLRCFEHPASPADFTALVSVPVLLVVGERDEIAPPDFTVDVMQHVLGREPEQSVILPGISHQIMLETPDLTHAVIASFFSAHWLPRSQSASAPRPNQPVQNPVDAAPKTADKWNLKNAAKWASTDAVSGLVAGLPLRAMKTLREETAPSLFDPNYDKNDTEVAVAEPSFLGPAAQTSSKSGTISGVAATSKAHQSHNHTPLNVIAAYPRIKLVVDLSSVAPPYDPATLLSSGVQYCKLSTISKAIPSRTEVAEFVNILCSFYKIVLPRPNLDPCAARTDLGSGHETLNSQLGNRKQDPLGTVAAGSVCVSAPVEKNVRLLLCGSIEEAVVHCHYGFNRTGFMIVSFLVEILGMEVADAISAFAAARPPSGIRHIHFKDELYIRYALPRLHKKSPTDNQ